MVLACKLQCSREAILHSEALQMQPILRSWACRTQGCQHELSDLTEGCNQGRQDEARIYRSQSSGCLECRLTVQRAPLPRLACLLHMLDAICIMQFAQTWVCQTCERQAKPLWHGPVQIPSLMRTRDVAVGQALRDKSDRKPGVAGVHHMAPVLQPLPLLSF